MTKLRHAILVVAALCCFCASSLQAQDTLYAATGSNGTAGELYTVDVTTNTFTLIAPIVNGAGGGGIGITGLAFNPLTDTLYGVTVNNTASGNTLSAHLVTIDPTTGIATDKGPLGSVISDISFRADGTLFGFQTGQQVGARALVTINLDSGLATVVGPSGLNATTGGGLAFSGAATPDGQPAGSLYLSATGTSGTLDRLNPMTGGRTPGPTLNGAVFSGAMAALAFNGSTLYAANGGIAVGGITDVDLVTIDLVTGAVDDLFSLPDNTDGIAWHFAAIPEPSTTALFAFGTLASLGLLIYRRRRS